MYRPDGWKLAGIIPIYSVSNKDKKTLFKSDYEAGADAMLKALRERGEYYKSKDNKPDRKIFGYEEDEKLWESLGYLVFIPDDKE